MQSLARSQPFDGGDLPLPHLDDEDAAGGNHEVVEPDGAGRAGPLVAGDLRAGKAKGAAQGFGEGGARLDQQGMGFAIDPEDNGRGAGAKDRSGGRFFVLLQIFFHQGRLSLWKCPRLPEHGVAKMSSV
jgi:hypothetical protein